MWDTEYSLALHLKMNFGKSVKHDNTKRIAVTYFKSEDSGAISRSLRHKGFDTFLAIRKISSDERKTEISDIEYRIRYTTYDSWAKFLDDENKFDLPEGWIEKINQIRKNFKFLE